MKISEDEVERNIRQAYEIVRRIRIEEPDLLKEAFIYALGVVGDDISTAPASMNHGTSSSDVADVPYEKIAHGLDLPVGSVELLFELRGTALTLTLPAKTLPYSVSAAMREIGTLLAVGYKYAGLGAGAPFDAIRETCAEHNKLDKKNFAAAMTGMKPRVSVAGKGSQRELIPKRPADDLARELILRYAQIVR